MIIGTGVDILEISRIKNLKNPEQFEKKHFTEKETEFFSSRKNREKAISNNFCAKEAFSKALGSGVKGFCLSEIEVLRDENGKPYINLYGNAKEVFEKKGGKNVFVSISDTDELSEAFVIIEG